MAELPADERLAAILTSVGEHLVVATTGTAPAVAPAARPRRYRLAVVAAIVVVVLMAALALPPVRTAVARWLGIGSTQVRFGSGTGSDPTGLPPLVAGASALTTSDAESLLGGPLPDTSNTPLGPAQRLARPPEDGVVLVWSEGATTLWVHHAVAPADVYQKKLVSGRNRVEAVAGLGDGALLVSGEHVLETPSRRVAARTVLLWTVGTTEYRLESDLEPSVMVAVARAIER